MKSFLLPAALALTALACAPSLRLPPSSSALDTGLRRVRGAEPLDSIADLAGLPSDALRPGTGQSLRPGTLRAIPIDLTEINLPPVLPGLGRAGEVAVDRAADLLAPRAFAWPISDFRYSRGFHAARRGRPAHNGIDLSAPRGTPIRVVAPGRVVEAGPSGSGYGRWIVVDHGGGVRTIYAHCSRLRVEPGDWVERGAVVGEVGATGNATGSHLHFEIRVNGTPVDPAPYLPDLD